MCLHKVLSSHLSSLLLSSECKIYLPVLSVICLVYTFTVFFLLLFQVEFFRKISKFMEAREKAEQAHNAAKVTVKYALLANI